MDKLKSFIENYRPIIGIVQFLVIILVIIFTKEVREVTVDKPTVSDSTNVTYPPEKPEKEDNKSTQGHSDSVKMEEPLIEQDSIK